MTRDELIARIEAVGAREDPGAWNEERQRLAEVVFDVLFNDALPFLHRLGDATKPQRRRLPDERRSVTHKFSVGGSEGYVIVGLYPDGTPGEMFVKMAKEGSTLSGLIDGCAIACSMALQYGVPPTGLFEKLAGMSFEPSGFSQTEGVGYAKSILDYLARWVMLRFGDAIQRASVPPEVTP